VAPGGTVTVTDDQGSTISIAAGPIVSLFDGALQFTYGRNFSVRRKKAYWGMGFSFIRLASAVVGAVK
jgi:hypothetical protein